MAAADVGTAKVDHDGQQAASQPSISQSDKFFRYFQNEVTDLQTQMTGIQKHATSGGERADAVDHCLSGIARLSTEVQDASSYIPAYDQRTYGDAIKGLNARLQEVRSSVAPKPKFSFKSGALFSAKKNESAISINDAAELAWQKRHQMVQAGSSNVSSFATTPIEIASPDIESVSPSPGGYSMASNLSISVKDHNHEQSTLPQTADHAASSGSVTDIKSSVVNMAGSSRSNRFAGLTLKNISHSLIICGHVSGAIHLTNVKDSTVVVVSRQFRMHDSSNCNIFLLTTSRPIIEDCEKVRFAPLPEFFKAQEDEKVENQWEKVDDFKWLRNEQSPNWSVLEVGKRLKDDTWRNVVSGDLSTDEMLKAVGVGE